MEDDGSIFFLYMNTRLTVRKRLLRLQVLAMA